MYERGGVWYVDFRADGKRYRISTYERDQVSARACVEATRKIACDGAVTPDDDYLRYAIERARYKAARKGVPFGLTMQHMRRVYQGAGGVCAVSGHPFELKGPFRPSLDRITPSLGYMDGNVRIVCLIANTAMLNYGESALLELTASVAKARNLLPSA